MGRRVYGCKEYTGRGLGVGVHWVECLGLGVCRVWAVIKFHGSGLLSSCGICKLRELGVGDLHNRV